VGIHGIGGIWGALATGLFASIAANPNGANGLFFGNPYQFIVQAIGVVATMTYSFIGSAIILKIIDVTIGLRITEEEEVLGLDLTQHNEIGYSL
jgi:Amt family ammonium transporter